MKRYCALIAGVLLLLTGGHVQAALTPGASYGIYVLKMNSNGTLSEYSSTTAVADSTGKLSFSLSSLPTTSDCNFIVFRIADTNGNLIRKGFAPAPSPGSTNMVGINDLSTAQTNAILRAAELFGSDDPIAMAYLLVLLRSSEATENDASILAQVGGDAIRGDAALGTGFEGFLRYQDRVTAAQLATFKTKLIYNGTSGKKTIADLTRSFKEAVDSGSATTALQEMQKAGGFMADVFMDAAEAAGIDFMLILAAHDAAGAVADNDTNRARILQVSAPVRKSLEQAMTSFFMRIASVKVKSEYSSSLTTLNASGTQVNSFLTAVQTMMNGMANIDATYGEYFQNPDAYITRNGTTQAAVQAAINQAFQSNFESFQSGITSSDADITTMRSNVVAAFQREDSNFSASYLPQDFGTYISFSGSQRNWPIPQVVMVNWMAGIINAGGSLSYTRDDLAVPSMMGQWMGTCSDPMVTTQAACNALGPPWNWSGSKCINQSLYNSPSCASGGYAWSAERRTYNTPSSAFNAYLGIQEDVQVIEFSRYSNYQEGRPSREQEMQFRLLFQQRVDAAAGRISGTTNGTTATSTAQKKATIKLLMQPSMD